jgi:hypothetical protein
VREASQRLLANPQPDRSGRSGATASVSEAGEATRATSTSCFHVRPKPSRRSGRESTHRRPAVSALVAQSQAGIGRAGSTRPNCWAKDLAGADLHWMGSVPALPSRNAPRSAWSPISTWSRCPRRTVHGHCAIGR